MSKPFDATLKDLGSAYPADYLTAFDRAPREVAKTLNVDLSTVTTAGDLVYGLGDPLREVVHIDFQASNDRNKGADMLAHSALLYRQYRVGVHGILVLLRPQAAHSEVNGSVAYAPRSPRGKMDFGYEIVRLWQRPAEALLAGPLGAAPLAILGALPEGAGLEEGLTGVADRLVERLRSEGRDEGQIRRLLTSAFILCGLRVKLGVARQVFSGVKGMHESDTYIGVLEEGREMQSRDFIRLFAKKTLGEPDEQSVTRLEGITDLDRLERILVRAWEAKVGSWQELLDTP